MAGRKFLTHRIQERLPDITRKLSSSWWGDAITFSLFSVGGLFLGAEVGLLTGTTSASRTIMKDPECRNRIEKALRNYRMKGLEQEIEQLRRSKMPAIM